MAERLSEMGWTATVIPEEYGGLGLSYLELCVIAEEIGQGGGAHSVFFLACISLRKRILMAGSEAQKEEWLPRLAAGEAIGTLAMSEGAGRPDGEKPRV